MVTCDDGFDATQNNVTCTISSNSAGDAEVRRDTDEDVMCPISGVSVSIIIIIITIISLGFTCLIVLIVISCLRISFKNKNHIYYVSNGYKCRMYMYLIVFPLQDHPLQG